VGSSIRATASFVPKQDSVSFKLRRPRKRPLLDTRNPGRATPRPPLIRRAPLTGTSNLPLTGTSNLPLTGTSNLPLTDTNSLRLTDTNSPLLTDTSNPLDTSNPRLRATNSRPRKVMASRRLKLIRRRRLTGTRSPRLRDISNPLLRRTPPSPSLDQVTRGLPVTLARRRSLTLPGRNMATRSPARTPPPACATLILLPFVTPVFPPPSG
jgi:hypothetical protein